MKGCTGRLTLTLLPIERLVMSILWLDGGYVKPRILRCAERFFDIPNVSGTPAGGSLWLMAGAEDFIVGIT